MKSTLAIIGTLAAVLALTLTLAMTALAAPKGNQANCPNGPPEFKPQRSYAGNANACGPKRTTSLMGVEISLA
jgi:hypothetical protein